MIGVELQKIIDNLELTPEEFATNIGVGKSSIYKILRGDTKKITKTLAEKINANYSDLSVKYLLSLNSKTQIETFSNKDNSEILKLLFIKQRLIGAGAINLITKT